MVCNNKHVHKGKRSLFKMKDVGMTVPKTKLCKCRVRAGLAVWTKGRAHKEYQGNSLVPRHSPLAHACV